MKARTTPGCWPVSQSQWVIRSSPLVTRKQCDSWNSWGGPSHTSPSLWIDSGWEHGGCSLTISVFCLCIELCLTASLCPRFYIYCPRGTFSTGISSPVCGGLPPRHRPPSGTGQTLRPAPPWSVCETCPAKRDPDRWQRQGEGTRRVWLTLSNSKSRHRIIVLFIVSTNSKWRRWGRPKTGRHIFITGGKGTTHEHQQYGSIQMVLIHGATGLNTLNSMNANDTSTKRLFIHSFTTDTTVNG